MPFSKNIFEIYRYRAEFVLHQDLLIFYQVVNYLKAINVFFEKRRNDPLLQKLSTFQKF